MPLIPESAKLFVSKTQKVLSVESSRTLQISRHSEFSKYSNFSNWQFIKLSVVGFCRAFSVYRVSGLPEFSKFSKLKKISKFLDTLKLPYLERTIDKNKPWIVILGKFPLRVVIFKISLKAAEAPGIIRVFSVILFKFSATLTNNFQLVKNRFWRKPIGSFQIFSVFK